MSPHDMVDEGLEILDEDECRRLLATQFVGRVGVSVGALPAIFPVAYTIVDGDVVFRTGRGTKLAAALRGAVVAFEVDHVDLMWRQGWSVHAVGRAEEIHGQAADAAPVAAWAPGDRHHTIRIRPELLTGRRIRREAT
jgi:uncharacterized protein